MTVKQKKLEESGIVTEKAANDDGKRPGAYLTYLLRLQCSGAVCRNSYTQSPPVCS